MNVKSEKAPVNEFRCSREIRMISINFKLFIEVGNKTILSCSGRIKFSQSKKNEENWYSESGCGVDVPRGNTRGRSSPVAASGSLNVAIGIHAVEAFMVCNYIC